MKLETQFESDQFLKLLTDALRAGPGSPQWHEAVGQLRADGSTEADEYRLLLQAREDLESGREYRSVRAGPGFTRKVLDGIEQETAGGPPKVQTTNFLAILGVVGILGVAVLVFILVVWHGGGGGASDLGNINFLQTYVSAEFSQGSVPAEWMTFGLAPAADARDGVLKGAVEKGNKDFRRGGICLKRGMPPAEPFAVEATIRVKPAGLSAAVAGDIAVQVFITDAKDFEATSESATPHELVCYLSGGVWSVAKAVGAGQSPGQGAAGSPLVGQTSKAKETNRLTIKVDRESTIVECNGQRLYTGPHGLAGDRARYPGIRFVTRGNERAVEQVAVESIRVLKP